MATAEPQWLELERIAHVEASSEETGHPVVGALSSGAAGWRASTPGEQVIRVAFRRPIHLHRVRLVFREATRERTQEFTLRWSSHRGETHREIVRQQFNFSPFGATGEIEDHWVDLPDVTGLELRVVPDVRGGDALASLAELRIA
jgi:hypothetical protein